MPISFIQDLLSKLFPIKILKGAVCVILAILAFAIAPTSNTVEPQTNISPDIIEQESIEQAETESPTPAIEAVSESIEESISITEEPITEEILLTESIPESQEAFDAESTPSTEKESNNDNIPAVAPVITIIEDTIIEPPTQEQVIEESSNEHDYVGNKNSKKFHYSWCGSVNTMSGKNKYFFTGTRDEMIAMGYDPCKNCEP